MKIRNSDGGALFSPDGSKLIWRACRPASDEEVKIYKDLLANGLVMPTSMELYIANADGSDVKKLTDLGKANWAPFFIHQVKKSFSLLIIKRKEAFLSIYL